jgi:hypothetical protein
MFQLMETCMRRTAITRLADNLKDVPLLFPPLKYIAVEIASFCGLIYLLVRLWRHL